MPSSFEQDSRRAPILKKRRSSAEQLEIWHGRVSPVIFWIRCLHQNVYIKIYRQDGKVGCERGNR